MSIVRGDPNARYLPLSAVTDMGGDDAVGFIRGIYEGFEATTKAMNPYSFEVAFQQAEYETRRKVKEAGYDLPPLDAIPDWPGMRMSDASEVSGFTRYTDFQRAAYDADTFANQTGIGGEGLNAAANKILGDRIAIIEKAKAARPDLGIQSYEEMRENIIAEGTKRLTDYYASRGGFGTNIGSMIGEMFGGVIPSKSNPLWAANFVGGGFGKTVGLRLLSQFGSGAGAEVANQLTGSSETMKWFGHEQTAGQRLLQIGLAGVLPLAVQGVGEGAAHWVSRRAARAVVPPPAPRPAPAITPPPPVPTVPMAKAAVASDRIPVAREIMESLGLSSMERPRFAADIDTTVRHADQFGMSPGDLRPPTTPMGPNASVLPNYTAKLGPDVGDAVALPESWGNAANRVGPRNEGTPDLRDVARGDWGAGRAVDPEVFTKLDKVAKDIDALSEQLARATALAAERAAPTDFGTLGRIEPRRGNAATTRATQTALDENLAAGARVKGDSGTARVAKRGEAIRKMQSGEGPIPAEFDPAKITARIAAAREKQGELMSLAERAMARAKGEWQTLSSELPPAWHEAVAEWSAKQAAAGRVKKLPRWITAPNVVKKLREIEPTFKEFMHPAALKGGKANEPKIDTVNRVQEAVANEAPKVNDAQLGVYQKLATEAEEVPSGSVRLYHGAYPAGDPRADKSEFGRWVTTDPEYARNHRAVGGPKTVYYVDVPESALKGDMAMDRAMGVAARVPDQELPAEYNAKFKELEGDGLDQYRDTLAALADETMELDGKPMKVRDFLKAMDEEKHTVSIAQGCATSMGYVGGSEG